MAGTKAKGGKKTRKFGRWSRAPSMKMYVATNRCEVNKRKKMERHRKRMAKKK